MNKAKEIKAACVEAMLFKHKLGQIGLPITMQRMEEVTRSIGWEAAEILATPKQRKAASKALEAYLKRDDGTNIWSGVAAGKLAEARMKEKALGKKERDINTKVINDYVGNARKVIGRLSKGPKAYAKKK